MAYEETGHRVAVSDADFAASEALIQAQAAPPCKNCGTTTAVGYYGGVCLACRYRGDDARREATRQSLADESRRRFVAMNNTFNTGKATTESPPPPDTNPAPTRLGIPVEAARVGSVFPTSYGPEIDAHLAKLNARMSREQKVAMLTEAFTAWMNDPNFAPDIVREAMAKATEPAKPNPFAHVFESWNCREHILGAKDYLPPR